ncbi:hypothetical protein OEZ85_008426 [Tetradesmus obliquus]|uniref:[RNA-polymerase]-subunit kinase n=1 Tax=Tetradesmus obliquus TaxID=3088 RepID=A0ABY8TJ58_TETOB|nr:hypothetical protein OEZ85_008426 [Tetradesmus obliquus]
MDNYDKGVLLGRGTFASVFKATHKETGKIVAIKKIDVGGSKEGINVTSLREIKLLREIKSPYVVELLDVFPHKRKVNMVMEFLDSDLEALIKAKGVLLSPSDVKAYMQMLLKALADCHAHWVLHRDVKPNNMLISRDGSFKLADFGLARIYGSPDRQLTPQVFARWYRAPELLFGSQSYGASIDIWAAGCVFAELLLRKPWLPGMTDIDQLGKIFQALGTPTKDNWPGVEALPNYVPFQPVTPLPLRQQFPGAADDALELLARMVALDPNRRPSAAEALRHPYFSSAPPPTPPERLPKPPLREDNPLAGPAAPALKVSRPPPAGGEVPSSKRAKLAGTPVGAAAAAASPAAASAAAAALRAAGTASPAG